MIVRGDGRLHLRRPRQALPRRAGRPVRHPGRPRPHRARRGRRQAGRRAGVLPAVVLRPPRRDRAGRAARRLRPRRPEPGLLHHRRRRGRRDRLEAGQAVLQAHRQADQAQGDQPGDRLPRHPAGRPVDHRAARHEGALRAAGALARSGCRTRTSTAPPTVPERGRRPRGLRPLGRRPDRRGASSSRAPTPSPRSSSSRCRTPAAASRRRPATSSGSARSATSTTCCWSPTR